MAIRGIVGCLTATIVLAAGAANAQSDMMGKARGLLGTLGGNQGGAQQTTDIAAGLKEALRVGVERVTARVGAVDGFNLDPAIHIPLPGQLQTVQQWLGRVGMSGMADDLETRMNRAAEIAAGDAKTLLWDAVAEMTLDDAKRIFNGPQDAATQYFRSKMTPALSQRMRPLVDDAMAEAGAVKAYDGMMGRYRTIPMVPDVKADLSGYVVDKGLDGIFHYVAKEEAAIRTNPAARSTDLLRRVFGGG
ncbi:MAG: DUF4197 domain-containing protein [Rhodospirillales bacterium]|jgi:hypothetical protein|nr:DUF4197 domain-containing protein [Rhodospirillales bacterium]